MKKLLYTVMCCCALASCTNLDSERYDAINPDFFPTNEKDAEALVVGGVYAPFRSAEYSGVFSTAHSFQVIGDMSTDIAVCCWVNDSWIPLTTHNWTPNHSYTTLNYTDYAKYLGTMTLTLDRISNVEMSDEKKALLMAETHLGRGWLAFLLYDFYGPIPIPTLIAFDVNVFRIYPYSADDDIEWQDLLKTFDFGTIKTTKTGVIGRALTTSNDLNISTLRSFLGQQAMVIPVAEGKFVVPNLWFARFDIGKCSARDSLETGLSVLAKASLEHNNRIFSDITLEATNGQITQFNVRSRIGENFMIIGIPNQIFDKKSPKSETVVFMVPRIIRTLKTNKTLQNNR